MIAAASQPNIRYSVRANTRSETLPEKKSSNDSFWLLTCHFSCPIWPRKEKVFFSLYFSKLLFGEELSDLYHFYHHQFGFTTILCQVIPYSLCLFSNSLWLIHHHLKQKYPLSMNTLHWLKFSFLIKIKTIRHQRPPLVLWSIWSRIGQEGHFPALRFVCFNLCSSLNPMMFASQLKELRLKSIIYTRITISLNFTNLTQF